MTQAKRSMWHATSGRFPGGVARGTKKLLTGKALTLHKDLVSAERLSSLGTGREGLRLRGPHGKLTLSELFQGRSQLYIKHFMMAPGAHHQCVGCSSEVDT